MPYLQNWICQTWCDMLLWFCYNVETWMNQIHSTLTVICSITEAFFGGSKWYLLLLQVYSAQLLDITYAELICTANLNIGNFLFWWMSKQEVLFTTTDSVLRNSRFFYSWLHISSVYLVFFAQSISHNRKLYFTSTKIEVLAWSTWKKMKLQCTLFCCAALQCAAQDSLTICL